MVHSTKLDTSLFADDAVLTYGCDSLKNLEKVLNIEVKKLHDWFIANKLTLNLKKTKFMLFSNQRKKKNKYKKFKININNYCIKQVPQMEYLGVIIDNKLNWHDHIQYVSTKLSKAAGFIYKFRNEVPKDILKMLYHSIGASYIRYGIASWGTAKPTALRKLQTMQNKIIRYMTHSPESSNIFLQYNALEILTVDELYIQEVAKFMYRSQNSTLPASFDEYFQNINHGHNTRSSSNHNLSTPRPRTELGKISLKYVGTKIWNDLPPNIRNAKSMDIFKDQIKSHLISKRVL